MAIACKFCILTKGLKGSEIGSLPQTEEELFRHIEAVHHIPVRREGESEEAGLGRFQRENPEAGGPNCRCPDCRRRKGENN
jgi:hypothetical protein